MNKLEVDCLHCTLVQVLFPVKASWFSSHWASVNTILQSSLMQSLGSPTSAFGYGFPIGQQCLMYRRTSPITQEINWWNTQVWCCHLSPTDGHPGLISPFLHLSTDMWDPERSMMLTCELESIQALCYAVCWAWGNGSLTSGLGMWTLQTNSNLEESLGKQSKALFCLTFSLSNFVIPGFLYTAFKDRYLGVVQEEVSY